ncbi:hypothetical protein SHKM778_82750 [Streptomyces sp. KM77-8]|uniref:Penicillin-binding protein transpeptidase domain-containing protein n=1 Tax=Streptomyces haneummycinicus TaxID=3074435 RepID=A0AAT9HW40_9ACTN
MATASVLDMAEAYATLANHGKHGDYTMIEKITRNGKAVELPERHTRQAVSRQAADTTTSVLRGVVENGTATAAQTAGRPAAGKTGTAEEDTAAWFAGYTPTSPPSSPSWARTPSPPATNPSTAPWVSPDQRWRRPAEIWGQYTREALDGVPVTPFSLRLQPGAWKTQPPPSDSSNSPSSSGEPDDSGDGGSEAPDGTDTGTGTGTGTGTDEEVSDGQNEPESPRRQTDDGGTTTGETGEGGANGDENPVSDGLTGALTQGTRWDD